MQILPHAQQLPCKQDGGVPSASTAGHGQVPVQCRSPCRQSGPNQAGVKRSAECSGSMKAEAARAVWHQVQHCSIVWLQFGKAAPEHDPKAVDVGLRVPVRPQQHLRRRIRKPARISGCRLQPAGDSKHWLGRTCPCTTMQQAPRSGVQHQQGRV